jgi:hypothetical protein
MYFAVYYSIFYRNWKKVPSDELGMKSCKFLSLKSKEEIDIQFESKSNFSTNK